MKISHIEHLGIAVQSIEEALPYFKEVLGDRKSVGRERVC